MALPRIINSLLETDLYKFSMGQAIHHQFPTYNTTWAFKCRNQNVKFTSEMVEEIKNQIKAYCQLKFTKDELTYLASIGAAKYGKGWLKQDYLDRLRDWCPHYEHFTITEDGPSGLSIRTAGTWFDTSMYEIPTLAIVNEVYFRMAYDYDKLFEQHKKNTDKKILDLIDGKYEIGAFSEFGLRRRLSAEAQEYTIGQMVENNKKFINSICVGTSNVFLAKKYNVTPIGTMAHEFIQCVGQGNPKHTPEYSNYYAMDAWVKEYGILNGTYLTDCITDKLCHMDMNLTFSTLFSGVRNDSGDMYQWADSWIKHFEKFGIDPKTKTLLFSNSLDFERADKLVKYVNGRAKTAFGIGTWLANDIAGSGAEPLNIVMKVVKCNNTDVAKISDDVGKGMCENQEYIEELCNRINKRVLKGI